MLSACSIAVGRFRCTKKLDCTQRTCVLAEWEDVVHISLLSSGGFVTRIPFILTQVQGEICVVIIFLCTLVSFQKQPGEVDREESMVCSDIFPAWVFRGAGLWAVPILHHHCSQGLWMDNSTGITRKSRSCVLRDISCLWRARSGRAKHHISSLQERSAVCPQSTLCCCYHSERCVLPGHLSSAQKAEFFLRDYIMSSRHPF